MALNTDPQIALDEREIEDAELERVLEDRERAKGAAGEARKKYSTLDDLAKGKIADLELSDGDAVRIGRFRILQTAVPARSVAFDTDPTTKLTISSAQDD